jgi:lipopolysaccharide transport system permease protein
MSRWNLQLTEVFFTKLRLNLKAEVSKTYLGYAWWVLEPALYVAILFLVFGTFRGRGSENFVAFLVCGTIPYLWFQKSVMNATSSIIAGRGLINQVAISKAFFPMLVVFQDIVKQAFVFGVMFCFLIAYGIEPGWAWLFFVSLVAVQLLVIIAGALFVALVTAYIPDFKFLVTTATMLLLFCSGLFFNYEDVILEKHHDLFLLNPMARLIKNYRQVLLDHSQPDWLALCLVALVSIAAIGLLLTAYRKADTSLARLVVQ